MRDGMVYSEAMHGYLSCSGGGAEVMRHICVCVRERGCGSIRVWMRERMDAFSTPSHHRPHAGRCAIN